MKKILLVDDEPNLLSALQRGLRRQFTVETACGGSAGLTILEKWQDFAVVVADMQMPEMNGVQFLAKVRESAPDIVRMMLTGNADQATAMEAVNQGNIFRFLNKPCTVDRLADALNAGVRQHQLITAERDLLENTLRGSIKVLTDILGLADPKAFGDAERLRYNVRRITEMLQVPDTWEIDVAAMLSQIGFVTIPPETQLKARQGRPLTPREQEMFKNIPSVGGELLSKIPRLENVARILTLQSKNFDGSGFPDEKIAGEEIPLGSRILRVLCDLGEVESRGRTSSAALTELKTRRGNYDPRILEAAAALLQVTALQPAAPAKQPAAIRFTELRVGHILREDIQTRDGTLIITAGNRMSPALMARLRNFSALSGIKEPIYVEP